MKRLPTQLEKQEMMIAMRAQGTSFDNISKDLKVSKQTLIQWSRLHEDEINNARIIYRDALRSSLSIDADSKIKELANLRSKLVEELLQRDFKEISANQLMKMIFQIDQQLQKYDDSDELFKSSSEPFALNESPRIKYAWKA